MRQKPHVVVHECVPGFDEQILCRYLNAGYSSWSPLYEVQSVVWNVLHEGFPVSRDRRYTICVLAEYECSSVFQLESRWHDLVNAERRLSADVYSESDLDMIREDWACSRSLPAKRRASRGGLANWAWEALMLPSSRKVLQALRQDASEQEGFWLADLGAAEADVRARASAPDGRPLFRWLVNEFVPKQYISASPGAPACGARANSATIEQVLHRFLFARIPAPCSSARGLLHARPTSVPARNSPCPSVLAHERGAKARHDSARLEVAGHVQYGRQWQCWCCGADHVLRHV